MSNAVIIGLYSPYREVYWFEESDTDGPTNRPICNLHARMAAWLGDKATFTILEYLPNGWDHFEWDLGKRCDWWDKQLREQGYDIFEEVRA